MVLSSWYINNTTPSEIKHSVSNIRLNKINSVLHIEMADFFLPVYLQFNHALKYKEGV